MWPFYLLLGVAAAAAFLVLILCIRGGSLRTVRHTVCLKNLPPEFDGYRIAVISDLHNRVFGKNNEPLVNAVLASDPDLTVIVGDLHEGKHDFAPVASLLSGLASKGIVTYTEGNHDCRKGRHGLSDADYNAHIDRISDCGVTVLNDASVVLDRNGKQMLLWGQSWDGMNRAQIPEWDESVPVLMVCHDPLQFDRLSKLPDLMLSGHVHGGIVRLPWIGPVFSPGNGTPVWKRFGRRFFFPKYSRGLYRKGDHTLAVTQGLGFSVAPIRFIPSEILLITLKSDKN